MVSRGLEGKSSRLELLGVEKRGLELSLRRENLSWLGTPNRYGEYVGFECPRCGERRTHATPSVNLWRCWPCELWGSIDDLVALPKRPANAQPTDRPALPRRRVVSLDVIEVAAA